MFLKTQSRVSVNNTDIVSPTGIRSLINKITTLSLSWKFLILLGISTFVLSKVKIYKTVNFYMLR